MCQSSIMPIISLAVAAIACMNAHGVTYTYWNGPECGDWWSEANWTSGVPKGSDIVPRFSKAEKPDAGTTVAITNAAAIDCPYMLFTDGEWTLNLRGTLSLPNASSSSRTVLVESNAKLTVVGGVLEDMSFCATTGTGGGCSSVELRNVVTRGCYTFVRGGSDADSPDTYTIDGGVHGIRTWYPRLYDNMVVKGGIVRFGSIHGYDRYGDGKDTRRRTALEVSGGRAVIDGTDAEITSGSVGILARDRGVVDVTVGGNKIWLANGSTDGKHSVDVSWKVQDKALFRAAGPYVVNGMSTGRVEVVGGRFVMTSSFANWAGSNVGRYSSVLLDGGTLDFDFATAGSLQGTKTDVAGTAHVLVAGPRGARLRNRNNVTVTIGNAGFVSADGGTGGVTFDGRGLFALTGASAYAGGMTVRGCVQPGVATGALGAGTVTLRDGGTLSVSLASTALPPLAFANGAQIRLANADANLTVPSITGADASVMAVVSPVSREMFGTTDAHFVQSDAAPALDALGLPTMPVVSVTKESGNSAAELHLLTYDEGTKHFRAAAYTAGVGGGANAIAYVEKESVVMDGQTVGALVVNGGLVSGTGKIGSGSGNAYLVLLSHSNSGYQGQLTGAGSVDFGGARGYVLSGAGVNGVIGCGVNGYLIGSGGIAFYAMDNGGTILHRAQSYTGGTKVLGGTVELKGSGDYVGAFGPGVVEVLGGEYTGGSVRFNLAGATHSQDFRISGFGARTDAKTGALDFRADTTLTGQITLENDAMVCATAGNAGTFAKPIGGTGDLYLGGEGTLAVPGIDIAGDLHIEGNVTTTGSLLTGERFLFVDGTLTFKNDDDITVDAKVFGPGQIVLAGAGKVDFADLSVFDGTVDIAGRDAAIGAIFGIPTITNSSEAAATLTVAGATNAAYFGSVGEGVNLDIGGTFQLGTTAELPTTAEVSLSGGELALWRPTAIGMLSGIGRVSGDVLAVTGSATGLPVQSAETDLAISFDFWPSLTSIAGNWRLKPVGAGAALVWRRGTIVVVR